MVAAVTFPVSYCGAESESPVVYIWTHAVVPGLITDIEPDTTGLIIAAVIVNVTEYHEALLTDTVLATIGEDWIFGKIVTGYG